MKFEKTFDGDSEGESVVEDDVKTLREKIARLRPCRGCQTVLCTCFSELEEELIARSDDALSTRLAMKLSRVTAERDRMRAVLTEIGFTKEGLPIIGTTNRSARTNFEEVCRKARAALKGNP